MPRAPSVEVLLRPAVELHSVTVCGLAAALCLVAPWSIALNPLLGTGAAALFLMLGEIGRAHV